MSTVTKFEMDEKLRNMERDKPIEMKKPINAHDISLFKGCRLGIFINMFKSKYISRPAFEEFMEYKGVISKRVSKSLLNEIRRTYVLVADMNQEKDCNEKWKDFMGEKQYKLLESNQQYVIGYMLVDDTHGEDKHHYIDDIDTRLRGHNIADLMIRKYVNEIMDNSNVFTNYLYPKEILYSARGYWKKQLKFIFDIVIDDHDDYIYQLNTYDKIKKLCNIKMPIVWKELITMLVNEFNGYESSGFCCDYCKDDSNGDSDDDNCCFYCDRPIK
jgi:hypothetical protein